MPSQVCACEVAKAVHADIATARSLRSVIFYQRHDVSLYEVAPGQSGMPVLESCRGSCDVVPKFQMLLDQPLNDGAARRLGKVIAVPRVLLPLVCTR